MTILRDQPLRRGAEGEKAGRKGRCRHRRHHWHRQGSALHGAESTTAAGRRRVHRPDRLDDVVEGTPAFSVYSATKAAVRSFARTWTLDIKQRSIRVNALSPGATETEGLHGLTQTEAQGKELKAALVSGIELFVDGGMAQI